MRIALSLALVAAGHAVYVLGSLEPVTASTLFDAVTAMVLAVSAWRIARSEGAIGLPRVLLVTFAVLGVVKPIDLALSLGDGWQDFHVGWTLVAIGGVLLGLGAFGLLRLPGYRVHARTMLIRSGAWASAAGSLVYLVLAASPLLRGQDGYGSFLVGALLATLGWSLFAWGLARAAPHDAGASGQAPSP